MTRAKMRHRRNGRLERQDHSAQTFEDAAKQVQAEFAPYVQPGNSVVDELIRERREEARREEEMAIKLDLQPKPENP